MRVLPLTKLRARSPASHNFSLELRAADDMAIPCSEFTFAAPLGAAASQAPTDWMG
jgi:hypothetical protein